MLIKHAYRLVLIVMASLIFLMGNSTATQAVTLQDLKSVSEDSPFYDPTSPCILEGTSSGGAGKIFILGDSLGVGVTPELTDALPSENGWSVDGNSEVGRRIDQAFDVVDESKSQLEAADYVLVLLGTNSSPKNTTEGITELRDKIRQNTKSNAAIYWVPPHKSVATGADFAEQAKGISGIGFIENTTTLSTDRIHPASYKDLAELIVARLSSSPGGSNEERAFFFFVEKGLSPEQSAGIVGNMKAESGVNPSQQEISPIAGRGGYGLVQWTAGRRVAIENYARDTNRDLNSLDFQLAYVWYELTGSETETLAQRTNYNGPESAALRDLITKRTVEDATISFLDKYERAGIRAPEKRIRYAKEIFDTYSGRAPSSGTSAAGSCSLSSDNNAGNVVDIVKEELALGAKESDDSYLKYTEGNEQPWCGWFASWVFKKAGKPFRDGTGEGGYAYPSVSSITAYAKSGGFFYTIGDNADGGPYVPAPGDIAIFDNGISPWESHVTIIIEYDAENKKITTIGGNESDTVSQNTHTIDASYITGFMRYP